jgi:epoxyqueuosine reductase
VAVAAGNALREGPDDVALRGALSSLATHPDVVVREHAAWALAQRAQRLAGFTPSADR